ncbi:MAG: glycosyltransferase family 4 protein [Candidatus Sumerlaeaceae bacterium]
MRILFFSTEFPPHLGGVATLSLEQSVNLARLGHQVQVETIDFGPQPNVCQTTVGLRINAHHIETGAVKRLVPLTKIAWKASQQFFPDIFYASTHRGFGLPMALSAWWRKRPYAIYVHGSEILTELPSRARRAALELMLRGASVLTCNSNNTKRLLESHFDRLKRIEVIHPGIDQARLNAPLARQHGAELRKQWLEAQGLPCETVVLLSMCRLSRQKGIGEVLRALTEITRRNMLTGDWLYVIAGSGPDEKEFQQYATQNLLGKRVFFLGRVPYEQTAAVFQSADVYVQPSQPLESFGISFVEAEFCGLPCIGTKSGGIPEAVQDGVTGILVEPGDLQALSGAIVALVNNAERRRQMGQAARAFGAKFSWETHAQRLAEILEESCRRSVVRR